MAEQTLPEPVKKITDAASQAARAESEPPHVRRYRAVLFRAGLLTVVFSFAVLTYLVKTTPSFSIDLEITRALQLINYPMFAGLMNAVSWAGFMPQAAIIAALMILLISAFGLHWEAVTALAAALFSTGIDLLVKDLIQRARPGSSQVIVSSTLNSFSFPSGHVVFYIGFFGFVGFLVFSLLKPSIMRSFLLALIGALIILIGPSRIYLGEHWPSDVLGAYLLGSLTLAAIIQFYMWGKRRFFVRQPAAAGGK